MQTTYNVKLLAPLRIFKGTALVQLGQLQFKEF